MTTQLGEHDHVVPVLSLAASSDGDGIATSQYVDMFDANELEFIIAFNTLTSSDSTTATVWAVTCLASSTVTAAGDAIAFDYRLYSAAGADSAGTITAVVSSDSANVSSDESDNWMVVHVEPAKVNAAGTDKRWVHFVITTSTACDNGPTGNYSAVALVDQRHKSASMLSTTA